MPELQVASRREFDVWNEVPLVPQLTGMSCWAAAAAMIIGWRDALDVEPEQVATGAGRWAEYRDGLHPVELEDFARAWGLTIERKFDWSVEDMRELLHRFGPIWVGEASPGLHSIVITGLHGDGSADATWVRINDPWPIGRGERYTLPWRQLMKNFHNATTIAGVHAQVLHAGGRGIQGQRQGQGQGRPGGRSGSYRFHEERVTRRYDSNSIPSLKDVDMRAIEQRRRHHEDYYSFGSTVAVASSTIAAGEQYLDTTSASVDPLAGHLGTGANLYLVWNQMPSDLTAIDVVVHLHGYLAGAPNEAATRTLVGKAGLDLKGRARPTLGIIPRGKQITKKELDAARIKWEGAVAEWEKNGKKGKKPAAPRADRYTFDALLRSGGAGLDALVANALDNFCANVLAPVFGAAPQISRLIITAHSGGGAALNRLLRSHTTQAICNPQEVHVFDALYGAVDGVTAWVQNRIAEDRTLPSDQLAAQGGALRIAYTTGEHGTSAGSLKVDNLLSTLAGTALRAAYRAEDRSKVGHNAIPRALGPVWLTDARADLPASATSQGMRAVVRPVPSFALQQTPVDWCQMRQTIAATARAEERRWTRTNGTKYRENHADMEDALRDYWRAVPIAAADLEEHVREAAADNDDFAWSAAFICYVMRTAGVLPAHGFVFGSKHMTYIVGALRNRENSDRDRPFWLVDNVEVQLEAKPEPGDIICMNREVRNAQGNLVMTTHTTRSLRQRFWGNNGEHQNVQPWGSSHCALVIGTWDDPVNGGRFLETIGGNEGDSVRIEHTIALNPDGGIGDPAAHHIFGMIKLIGC